MMALPSRYYAAGTETRRAKGDLSPAIGPWWVHIGILALGLYLVFREARTA